MFSYKRWNRILPLLIWGLAAFFFFAHYVVRVTPGHISKELQLVFTHTTKFELGLLGTCFYVTYVLMQMPVGYLVDRFGPRLLLTAAVLICSFSSLLFANATVLSTAMYSRLLLGFCSATAFIGALKLITVWFDSKHLALLVGITQALGMIGAASGAHFAPYMSLTIGWRHTFLLYSVLFLILAILIFCIVRNKQHEKKNHRTITLSKEVLCVCLNKYTWFNALYAGFIYAPTDLLGEFWGKEFLTNIHSLNAAEASHSISFLFIGWAIGSPLAGTLADHFGRRPIMLGSAIIGFILLPIIFYIPNLPSYAIIFITFLYGLTNTGLIASYTTGGELHPKAFSGFSMAIANMFSVLLGALLMPILGKLLDSFATHRMILEGTFLHLPIDYQRATYLLPLCLFLAIIFAFLTPETMKKA